MTSTVPPGRGLSASLPRHFVPGYDQPVPPGQKPFAHRRASHKLALCGFTGLPWGEWREDKASLGGLLFYCPGGAKEFSPGFQPWETSNKAVRPVRARDGVGEMPSNATEKELGIC